MAFEHRNLSGSLFKNNKRDKETKTSPHAKGDALIDGVSYWISAWTKTDKNGNPWQSLSFTKKDDTPTGARIFEKTPVASSNPFADMTDDIPY
tara:strand:- start:5700 stop:5978 length:279 start_codon:yes stop_codon:yes gene_type:complete